MVLIPRQKVRRSTTRLPRPHLVFLTIWPSCLNTIFQMRPNYCFVLPNNIKTWIRLTDNNSVFNVANHSCLNNAFSDKSTNISYNTATAKLNGACYFCTSLPMQSCCSNVVGGQEQKTITPPTAADRKTADVFIHISQAARLSHKYA